MADAGAPQVVDRLASVADAEAPLEANCPAPLVALDDEGPQAAVLTEAALVGQRQAGANAGSPAELEAQRALPVAVEVRLEPPGPAAPRGAGVLRVPVWPRVRPAYVGWLLPQMPR